MAGIRLRKLSRDVHLWIGVALALVLAPLGLTGSWLVFDEPLDRMLHPQRYAAAAPDRPASAYFEAAREAFHGRAEPSQLRMPREAGEPVTVASDRGLTAWIDPASARVLDVGEPRRELRGFMHQLHGNLFMAKPGRRLVGALGLFMFLSSVTGLVIWWPRNNAVLKALRWRRAPSAWSNLHHMAGFWMCVPLAALSLTGAAIAFPEAVRLASGAPAPANGGGPRGGPPAPLPHPRLGADEAVAAAQAKAGPGRLQQVQAPAAGRRPAWTVQLRQGRKTVQARVDDATGAVRFDEGGREGERGGRDPVMRLIRQIHDGDDTGPVWRAVVFAAGLAPALLGVSGVVIWLGRRRA